MSYEQKISRSRPGLIILLLDDSGSMVEILPGGSDPKFKYVERYCGIILDDLLSRSSDVEGNTVVIKPRYYIHVIKYGGRTETWGTPGMDVEKAVQQFTDDGNSMKLGGRLGGTDTKRAFKEAYTYLQKAINEEKFKDTFPPMLFHLTDGMSHTDAKPLVDKIKQLTTTDGNVLVVNAYIGTQTSLSYSGPEDFTGYVDVNEAGPNPDNIRLFEMSSVAPESIIANLKSDNIFPQLRDGARLFFDVRTREMLKHVIQVIGSMGSRMAR